MISEEVLIYVIGALIAGVSILGVIILIITMLPKKEPQRKEPTIIFINEDKTDYNKLNNQSQEEINRTELIYPYHRVSILTNAEIRFYNKLRKITSKYGYEILTKIRLADLINVNSGLSKSEYNTYFSKIKSKHIDFAIHKNMNIICLIELDDYTHQREDRKERDIFVDTILSQNKYKIIHTYGETQEIENYIMTK